MLTGRWRVSNFIRNQWRPRLGLRCSRIFSAPYERHRDAVFRFAYRLLGAIEPAEDVAHDCFVSLIQHPSRFDASHSSLRTYLFAAARNLALKHFRDTSRDVTIDELPDGYEITTTNQPLITLLDKEVAFTVQRAVSQLPERSK